MKVTVCELHEEPDALARDWEQLVAHTQMEHSDLVLLPEMPFFPWFPRGRTFNAKLWEAAVAAHDAWEGRLEELAPAAVLGSRPIDFGNERYNLGFISQQDTDLRGVHIKVCPSDQEGLWESSWFHPAPPHFVPVEVAGVSIGFLIGMELWMMEQARIYARELVHLLVTPRATDATTLDRWRVGGRMAAFLAGAFGLSSNRVDKAGRFGGQGWIVNPDGDMLALTSGKRPFLTLEIDLSLADQAKSPCQGRSAYGGDLTLDHGPVRSASWAR
jgi:predicted amidohydrolase